MVDAVADAHRRDADTKRRICDAMAACIPKDGALDATLQATLQVWLATWILAPAVDDDAQEATLQLIKAEMQGF